MIKTKRTSEDPYRYSAWFVCGNGSEVAISSGETRSEARYAVKARIRDRGILCEKCGAYVDLCDCRQLLENKAQLLLEEHGRYHGGCELARYTAHIPGLGFFEAGDPRELKEKIMSKM